MLNEINSKPVEQPGMAGRVAAQTEVTGGGDKALSEMPCPHAIYDDARGERVVSRGNSASQFKASAAVLEGRTLFAGKYLEKLA